MAVLIELFCVMGMDCVEVKSSKQVQQVDPMCCCGEIQHSAISMFAVLNS